MFKIERRQYWIVGLTLAIASFIMFFIGVKIVLGNEVTIENIMAYMLFSVLVGIVAGLLVFFTLRIAVITFILGLIVGSFEMYRAFLNGMTGWGDLIGILSLTMWIIVGLGVGVITQLGYYLYKRLKK